MNEIRPILNADRLSAENHLSCACKNMHTSITVRKRCPVLSHLHFPEKMFFRKLSDVPIQISETRISFLHLYSSKSKNYLLHT